MIDKELLDFQYYYNKLPVYLKNSYGFEEHFKIWFDLLSTMDSTEDNIMRFFDIFNPDYLSYIDELEGQGSDILDKIGKIFNIKRNLSVPYLDGAEKKTKFVSLNNKDFLTFIRATIIKNYCNGSFEQVNNFYTNINLPIIYIGTNSPATVNVVMLKTQGEDAISEEIQTLFKGGLLNIKSMGIIYSNYTIVDFDSLAIWDLVQKTYVNDYTNNDKGWDGGQWGI